MKNITVKEILGLLSREIQRRPWLIFSLIALLSIIPLLAVVNDEVHGDVLLYERVGDQIEDGAIPYKETVLEYPPYAIAVFWVPRILCGERIDYQWAFAISVLAADLLLKLLLFKFGNRFSGLRRFLPMLLYSAVTPLWRFWFVQRYDIFPALMTVAALVLFWDRRFIWAGVMIALAGGVKMYPLLFAPPLWAFATRQSGGKKFAAGVTVGLLPLAVLAFFIPWWQFASFHGARGLQVESLYASLLWLGNHFNLVSVRWMGVKSWLDITGPAADRVLPWAKILFATATLAGVALSAAAARFATQPTPAATARLLLLPVLGFVAFNQVLSPQYMVWLLPLAALASLDKNPNPILVLIAATTLTPVFYPARDYGSGLILPKTLVLVARNLWLVTVFFILAAEFSFSLWRTFILPRLQRNKAHSQK
jgi:hypothetical protein